MKTIKNQALFNITLLLIAGTLMTACNQVTYRKSPGGMPYKIFKGDGGVSIHKGDYIKLIATTKIRDSVTFSNAGKPPIYLKINESTLPYDISEIWTQLKKGDSVITTQLIDTFMKRSPGNIPPQFKKGDLITTSVKVLDVFKSEADAHADDEKTKKEWLAGEISVVSKYLADKKIATQKTTSGAFVQILNPGTGNNIDSGKYISIKYRGTTFGGTVFDSNMDSAFHHSDDYSFVAGSGGMIKGLDEGILLLKNGSTAKVYIPSTLGYGPYPGSPLIKPYDNLIFDVTITNVQDKAPAPPVSNVPQQKVMETPKSKKK